MGYDIKESSNSATHKFGAGINRTLIEEDGTVKFEGNATIWKDLLPTAVYQPQSTSAPNITLIGGTGNLKAQEFPNNGTSEEFHPTWQLSHEWKEGSIIVPHLHLYIPNDANGGVLDFRMVYSWVNVNGTGLVEGTLTGTITRAANAGINSNAILSFGNLDGTGMKISSLLAAKIYRNTADTYNGSCWLRSADLHIECDTVGSRTALVK